MKSKLMLTTVDLKRRVEFARYFLPILRKIESENRREAFEF